MSLALSLTGQNLGYLIGPSPEEPTKIITTDGDNNYNIPINRIGFIFRAQVLNTHLIEMIIRKIKHNSLHYAAKINSQFIILTDSILDGTALMGLYRQSLGKLEKIGLLYPKARKSIVQEIKSRLETNMLVLIDQYFPGKIENLVFGDNPNITIDLVKKLTNNQWNWLILTRNPSITINDILDNFSLPWALFEISKNPNITFDILFQHKDIFPWDSNILSNPGLSIHEILAHPQLNIELMSVNQTRPLFEMNYETIARHPQFTPSLLHLIPKEKRRETLVAYFASNPKATFTELKDYKELIWKMVPFRVSTITINLSSKINIEDLRNNPNLFDPEFYSLSYNITMKDVDDNPKIKWHINSLSMNPNLTPDYVNTKRGKWFYDNVEDNVNISYAEVQENINRGLWKENKNKFSNPNISVYDVQNMSPIDRVFFFNNIHRNDFTKNYRYIIRANQIINKFSV